MTTDEFYKSVLSPFIRRHTLTGAAAQLNVSKGYLSRVSAGARPVTQAMAERFGVKLEDPEQVNPGKWARYCLDCGKQTYHRRVHMVYIDRPAVQCTECMTVEINLQARSLLERN